MDQNMLPQFLMEIALRGGALVIAEVLAVKLWSAAHHSLVRRLFILLLFMFIAFTLTEPYIELALDTSNVFLLRELHGAP